MSSTAHIISAILLLILITVMFGGFSFLWLLRDRLQGDQVWNFRAGHAHAGVLVILTLVVVDIADRAGASGQRLWMIATGLLSSHWPSPADSLLPWATGRWDEWSRQLVLSASQPQS
jgi:hypothetical protein